MLFVTYYVVGVLVVCVEGKWEKEHNESLQIRKYFITSFLLSSLSGIA